MSDMSKRLLTRLKFGWSAWNIWRRENPDVAIVLDGADLNGMILTGVDLREADLLRAGPTDANPGAWRLTQETVR